LDLKKQNIIFFDGVCNLCDAFISFVISHDKKKYFKIASLQGESAKIVLPQELTESLSTVILFEGGRIYTKSTAALQILKRLHHWSRLFIVFIILPYYIRDIFYDIVAQNRYRIFGQKHTCRIPTDKERSIFLD